MAAQGPVRALTENSKSDWQTPPALFKWLDSLFDFDLDAAASEENAVTGRYIDAELDAIGPKRWSDWWPGWKRAFCNPPYGNLLPWVERFAIEGDRHTVVALLPANTDTKWFAHCWATASEIWFLIPRVSFIANGKPVTGNTGGSMIVVWRPQPTCGNLLVRHLNWKEQARA